MRSRISVLLGTALFLGWIPGAPGTYASAAVALAYYAVYRGGRIVPELHLSVLCLVTIIGVLVSGEISRLRGHEDPSEIVIDEVAGQLLAYFLVPVSLVNLTAGFFLFRLFDIWKPFPARQAEDLKHGVGIMADDLIAGLYANIVLQFMSRLLPQ